jgi:3-hydroxyacyl-[acyl-carrier-protein] dehydratase
METLLDVTQIQAILPHRYPFLLVDRIIEYEPSKRVVGIKNVSLNEPFFAGHFPGAPVMPGVLIVEAMAQTAGVMMLASLPDRETKLVFFTGIDNAKFRRPVVPGDQLRLELTVLKLRPRYIKLRGEAYVDGQLVAEAGISSALVDRNVVSRSEQNSSSAAFTPVEPL